MLRTAQRALAAARELAFEHYVTDETVGIAVERRIEILAKPPIGVIAAT